MIIEGGTYSVYVHINKVNNKVYVGVTSKVPAYKRWRISGGTGYKRNKRFYADIELYGWNNFEHHIIASGLNEDEASNMEKILIDKLKATDPEFGYNTERGGLRKNENARKAKISRSVSGENHPAYGTHLSDETKNKISNAMKGEKGYWYGKKLPQETLDKMSSALKGRKIETEKYVACIKKLSKPVLCIETGVHYDSVNAAAKALNVSHVPISRAVNGIQQTAYKMHWKFD